MRKSEVGSRKSESVGWAPPAIRAHVGWAPPTIPIHPSSFILHPSAPRPGVTLLEVLVSMFVLAVGLLGLASLLPVASFYASEAQKYDRAATLAQQASHDVVIRGYLEPKSWLATTGLYAVQISAPAPPLNPDYTSYLSTSAAGANAGGGVPFLPPVVIDPLAISYQANIQALNALNGLPPGPAPPPLFPAFPVPAPGAAFGQPPVQLAAAPAIYRLTLDSARSWPVEEPLVPVGAAPIQTSFPLAQRLFSSNDDLVFQPNGNSDYRPGTLGFTSPDFAGDYSWLLTVAPDVDDVFQQDMANMDRFTVSVVIFYKRDLNLDQSTTTLDVKKAPPERMVFADLLDASAQAFAAGTVFPSGNNFAGGAVRLRTPTPGTTTPTSTAAWLDVKPNEWLMLSGFMYSPTSLPPSVVTAPLPNFTQTPPPVVAPNFAPVPFCQWYRIAGVGETLPIAGGGGWYRDVQLSGPDWNNFFYYGSPAQSYSYLAPDQPNAYPVQYQFATLATGAIAVYQSTITLDESILKD